METVNAKISPFPDEANPISVLSFVHEYELSPSVFIVSNDIISVVSPLHKIWFEISSTCAVGLTVMVNISDGPSQVTPLLV